MDLVHADLREFLLERCSEIVALWMEMLQAATHSCRSYTHTIHIWWWMRALHITIKAKMDRLHLRAENVGFSDKVYHDLFCLLPSKIDAEMECLVELFQRKVDGYEPVIDTSLNDITELISIIKQYLRDSKPFYSSHTDAGRFLTNLEMFRVPARRGAAHPDAQKVLQYGKDLMIEILQQCAAGAAEKDEVVKWTPDLSQKGHQREFIRNDFLTINVCELRIGNVNHVTQVSASVIMPRPFGTIAYVLSRDFRVRYYDPVYEQEQNVVTMWVPPSYEITDDEECSIISDDEDCEQLK